MTSMRNFRVNKLLEAATLLLPDEERTYNGYLSLLLTAMCTVLGSMNHEGQNGALLEIYRHLENTRKPLVDPAHCESCQDAHDLVSVIMPKLGFIEPSVAVSGLGQIMKVLLDTISDDEVLNDALCELENMIFPEEEMETLH